MSPWLKAGLIGAAVIVVLNLVGLIPCVGFFTCILSLLAYVCIGALAGYFVPPLREAGAGAGQGALAAVLAALIGGIVNTIVVAVQFALTDSAAIMSQIPAESLRQIQEVGMDPSMFTSPGFGIGVGSVCCLVGLVLAALLGAIGGAIFAAIKAD
jgi:hypothetical protein